MTDEICGAEKSDGSKCRSPIIGDVGRCPAHREGGAETMSERGKRGAQARQERRQGGGFDASELPEIQTMDDIRVWGEAVARACAEGEISEKRSNSLARLMRQIRGALEAKTEGRIEALRQQVEAMRKQVEEPWKT